MNELILILIVGVSAVTFSICLSFGLLFKHNNVIFHAIIQIGTKGKTEVIDDELNPVWKEVSIS
jgi:hypothetical protein